MKTSDEMKRREKEDEQAGRKASDRPIRKS
jgi:hypothetical protein